MFDMANDSGHFHTAQALAAEGWRAVEPDQPGPGNAYEKDGRLMLPLYEAKTIGMFDHRQADIVVNPASRLRPGQPRYLEEAEHADPHRRPRVRYWVEAQRVADRIPEGYRRDFYLGFANITSATNRRSLIVAALPGVAVGHSLPLMLWPTDRPVRLGAALLGLLGSFAVDYLGRLKLGGTNYTYTLMGQLPCPDPEALSRPASWDRSISVADWLAERVVELVYTAWDLRPFALGCGVDGPPFAWESDRRFDLRCELDAACFHLLGFDEAELRQAMRGFPIVGRADRKQHGHERTERTILAAYRRLGQAGRSQRHCQTHPTKGLGRLAKDL
jgi:hypothetical protein